MNTSKQSICLNMIVKNEASIIRNTLENLCSYIEFAYWVISDTGSSDDTKEIITAFFKEKNISGELHDHVWIDFGTNRTLALQLAYKKTDYVFIFDADDNICGEFKLPNNLNKDSYMLHFQMNGNFTFNRLLLLNNRKVWSYKGILHEYLHNEEPTNGSEIIQGDYYVLARCDGSRASDPNKYAKDAQLLEKGFTTEIDNDPGLAHRYAFYCAQSYKDTMNISKAIEWYTKVLELNNWVQEKYYSCLMLGNLYKIQDDTQNALKYWLKTGEYDPERIEGIVYACKQYWQDGFHILVNALYHRFKHYNKHPKEKLFLFKEPYQDELEYYNSISAFYIGDKTSGYECCQQILKNNILPERLLEQTKQNMKFYVEFHPHTTP